MIRTLAIIFMLSWATPALPHGYGVGDIIVAHPHSFPTTETARTGIGYLTLMNNGTEADRLIEVRSPFPRATLHETVIEDGIASMVGTDGIEIPAGGTVLLEPGGKHIMFMGLDGDPLEVGEKFLATLVFERAGEIEVEFWVEERDPNAPAIDHSHHGMDHSDASGNADRDEQIIIETLRTRLAAHVEVPALAISGDIAIAGWLYGDEGGRAFLRKSEDDWQLKLLSGASLTTASGLRAQMVPPARTRDLIAEIEAAENRLPETQQARLNYFEGTVIVQSVR